MNVIKKINEWVNSFENNKNTAIKTEIITGIQILTDNNLDNIENIPDNYKLETELSYKYDGLIGISNLTQKDNICGTADILLIFENGSTKSFSVTKAKTRNLKKANKCIHNPSPKLYGISKEEYNVEIDEHFNKSLEHKKNITPMPSDAWRRCKSDPNPSEMCNKLALETEKKWHDFSEEDKMKKICKILDINDELITNTDGIIYSNDNGIVKIFEWNFKENIKLSEYLNVISDGIYIYHYKNDTDGKKNWFIKTQIKYNNGIVELPSKKKNIPPEEWILKKGNPCSSWNCTAKLEDIFNMLEIKPIE